MSGPDDGAGVIHGAMEAVRRGRACCRARSSPASRRAATKRIPLPRRSVKRSAEHLRPGADERDQRPDGGRERVAARAPASSARPTRSVSQPDMILRTLLAPSATPSMTPSDMAPRRARPRQEQRQQRIDHLARHVGEEADPPEQPDRARQAEPIEWVSSRIGSRWRHRCSIEFDRKSRSDPIISHVTKPFDAVLLVAFGGPQGPDDVRPFLANVLRGRRVSPGAARGSRASLRALRRRVAAHGADAARRRAASKRRCARGARRSRSTSACATGIRTSPRRWPEMCGPRRAPRDRLPRRGAAQLLGCTQYEENVRDARAALREPGACRAVDDRLRRRLARTSRLHRGQRRTTCRAAFAQLPPASAVAGAS